MDIVYFHGTNADYDAIDQTCLGTRDDCHPNSRMGLWVAKEADLAQRFGDHVLEVAIPEDRIETISIDDLSKMSRLGQRDEDGGIQRHLDYADAAKSRGAAVIFVVEQDGSMPTGVVVDLSAVRIAKYEQTLGIRK